MDYIQLTRRRHKFVSLCICVHVHVSHREYLKTHLKLEKILADERYFFPI